MSTNTGLDGLECAGALGLAIVGWVVVMVVIRILDYQLRELD
jgi:hypothetical protein